MRHDSRYSSGFLGLGIGSEVPLIKHAQGQIQYILGLLRLHPEIWEPTLSEQAALDVNMHWQHGSPKWQKLEKCSLSYLIWLLQHRMAQAAANYPEGGLTPQYCILEATKRHFGFPTITTWESAEACLRRRGFEAMITVLELAEREARRGHQRVRL